MENGFRNVATRIDNAIEGFVAYAVAAGLTRTEALNAYTFMRKGGRRAPLKIDPVNGTYHFSHGAFAEAAVLRRAAELGAK